jgi:hypothetical protein
LSRKSFITRILCACLLSAALPVAPSLGDVLHDQDNGPLTGIFGVPDSTEGGVLLAEGAQGWNLMIATASHSIVDGSDAENLLLDGETTRYEFRYRYGLADRLEIGVELPYVQHSAGQLDSAIDAWHDFFGFSAGNRPLLPRDDLRFIYSDSNSVPLTITRQSSGPGDLRLFAGWQLVRKERSATAIRFGVKFPTGDSARLHGSGGTDISLGIAGDSSNLWGLERLNGFYRASAIYLGEPEYLAERSESLVAYLSSGLGYSVSDRIELRVQGAIRTAAYDSVVKNLGEPSITLTFGGNVRLGKSYELSLGIGEDINVGSAPDVTFSVALRFRGD